MPANYLGKRQSIFSHAILPEGKRRWRSFGAGFCIELTLLACAIWVPMLFPKQMVFAQHYLMTQITAPEIDIWKPKPVPKPVVKPVARPRPKPVEVAKVEAPKPKLIEPVFEKPIAPKPVVKKIIQAPELKEWAKAMPEPNPLTNSAMPDLKKPKEPVQTGGFGDPKGLPAATKVTQTVNINQTGAFDMPAGPGKGNGTGGAKGVVGTAGFGDDAAVKSSNRKGGTVQSGGFADERTAGNVAHVQKAADSTPAQEPVVILSKPQPEYTTEARQEKIQGEVLLQVMFTSSGRVEVEKVVRGLGHGLDENAEAAARQIKFKPARQDGQPVDFPAIVRIEFALAY
ncbi:MAG TPA: TonB family protein [Candidatus Acidoferrales bacterium]|nr:TonB family protein [Candidatus Acidoferrales bacterium]